MTIQHPEDTAPSSLGAQRWKEVAKDTAKIVGLAVWKIISRTLTWGAAGLVAGLAVFLCLLLTGLLEISSPHSAYVRWGLLPAYVSAGAGLLGYAGMLRGMGRTLLHIGLERQAVAMAVERILEHMVEALRRSERARSAMDRGDEFLSNLPLQNVEDALKRAIQEYLGSGEIDGNLRGIRGWVARSVNRSLTRCVEKYLLSVARAEASVSGGGGVSMQKVLALAPPKAQEAVGKMIVGFMRKQLLLMSALAALAFAVPPSVIAFLR